MNHTEVSGVAMGDAAGAGDGGGGLVSAGTG